MHKTTYSVSYYDVLQIPATTSDEDVKKAYYKMAMRFHPDRNPGDRRMAELRLRLINEAYAHLKTRKNRVQYNRILKRQKNAFKPHNDNIKEPSEFKRRLQSGFSTLTEILWPIANKDNKEHS